MRYLFFLFFFSFSCATKKTTIATSSHTITADSSPENYTCNVEIKQNQAMIIKKDDFDRVYYDTQPNNTTQIIIYRMNRIVDKELKDGGYREEIVFETQMTPTTIELQDAELQNVKMLFGRFCYCKGKTGHYKVTSGKLAIKNKRVKINFKINEVPQIMSSAQFNY